MLFDDLLLPIPSEVSVFEPAVKASGASVLTWLVELLFSSTFASSKPRGGSFKSKSTIYFSCILAQSLALIIYYKW